MVTANLLASEIMAAAELALRESIVLGILGPSPRRGLLAVDSFPCLTVVMLQSNRSKHSGRNSCQGVLARQ